MTAADRRYLVIGAATTGRAVAAYLADQGARVRIVERAPAKLNQLTLSDRVERRVGDDDDHALDGVDAVIPSPGVPRSHVLLGASLARGIPILSEIELAARALACPILAITGTNGKSTTTVLLGEMLRQAGLNVFVGGNLGTTMIEACAQRSRWDAVVPEVSSFQLEWVSTFRPHVAVLLNLTPDHLDRYASLEEYGAAKAAILRMLQPTTGGSRGRGWGPTGTFSEDNNALALALLMVIPLMYFLYRTEPRRWIRLGLAAGMALTAFSVAGSFSRGAIVGGICMTLLLIWRSRNKFSMTIGALVIAVGVLSFMPQSWFERAQTIETYEEDQSAMKRINGWTFAWHLALDNPVLGGGFEVFQSYEAYDRYAPRADQGWIGLPIAPISCTPSPSTSCCATASCRSSATRAASWWR